MVLAPSITIDHLFIPITDLVCGLITWLIHSFLMVWLLMVASSGEPCELSHCSTGGHKLLFSTLSLCKCFKVKQIKKAGAESPRQYHQGPSDEFSCIPRKPLFPCHLSVLHVYRTSKIASCHNVCSVSTLKCFNVSQSWEWETGDTENTVSEGSNCQKSPHFSAAPHFREVTNTSHC